MSLSEQELEKILNGMWGKRCLISKLGKDENPEEKILAMQDRRACKPIGLIKGSEMELAFVQVIEKCKNGSGEIEFLRPNQVALYLSIATRTLNIAKGLFSKVIKRLCNTINYEDPTANKNIYDYFEYTQEMIIFSYTAIEAFANITIPNNYTYERLNSRRIKEILNKDNIERWVPTSEKIEKIIPLLMKTEPPTKEIMKNFKELEIIRNDLIHTKTNSDAMIFEKLLQKEIFDYAISSFDIIDYFCSCDPQNSIFPLGFENSKVNFIKINNYENVLKDIKTEIVV